MNARRSDWRTRICTHGNKVEHRLQIDAAYCHEPDCAAKALAPITAATVRLDETFVALLEACKLAAQHHQGMHSVPGIALRAAIAKAEGSK